MNDIVGLLKEYTKARHEKILKDKFKNKEIPINDFKRIYNINWEEAEQYPYIQITHLIDSYYCLPERPDMGFTYLWKAINTTYTDFYCKYISINPTNPIRSRDSNKLIIVLKEIETRLDELFLCNSTTYRIRDLVRLYTTAIPVKVFNFLASYILQGIAIEEQIGIESGKKYLKNHFRVFKSDFSRIYNTIKETYGQDYSNICTVSIDSVKGKCSIKVNDKDKEHKLTYSLGRKFNEMFTNESREAKIKKEDRIYTLKINSDEEYLKLLFKSILYAMRNSNIHGEGASRLVVGKTINKDTIKASNYIYLLGHMFLCLLLWINDDFELNQLSINIHNLNLVMRK